MKIGIIIYLFFYPLIGFVQWEVEYFNTSNLTIWSENENYLIEFRIITCEDDKVIFSLESKRSLAKSLYINGLKVSFNDSLVLLKDRAHLIQFYYKYPIINWENDSLFLKMEGREEYVKEEYFVTYTSPEKAPIIYQNTFSTHLIVNNTWRLREFSLFFEGSILDYNFNSFDRYLDFSKIDKGKYQLKVADESFYIYRK